jgi:hypothetical protein
MKKRIITLFSVLAMAAGTMQAQNGTWYFGVGGGLQFTGMTTAPLAGAAINTSEGCASIVDAANNVVMYTDGITVWNGSHVAQAGAGTLGGNPSATQTALIIPIPGQNCNSYFIFTTQAVETDYGGVGGNTGLRVSLATVTGTAPTTTVTITPANRNQLINTGGALMSERLTAVSNGSGGYWVIAHGAGTYGAVAPTSPLNIIGETRFYTVSVTAATTTIASLTAASTSFVTSPHQSWIHPYPSGGSSYRTQGQLKVSSNGARLAVAMSSLSELQLYDFNPATGVITNQRLLNVASGAFNVGGVTDATIYGVEFSPNSNVLYVSTTFGGTVKNVYQFDVTGATAAIISGTRFTASPAVANNNYTYGQLQLGPNGRIYIAKNPNGTGATTLDVINTPNTLGAGCGYSASSVSIAGSCRLGLPTVLLNNNCEGNGNPSGGCVCTSTATITASTLQKDGTGTATIALNSGGMLVRRLKITLVNFNQNVSPECLKCEMTAASQFGTITNTPVVNTVTGVLAPATSMGTATWSKQIIWTLNTPAIVNGNVVLNLRFPGVLNLSCCSNRVEYCFNVEYIDADCNICENTTCTSGGSPAQVDMQTPDVKVNETPETPVKPETSNKNDIMQLFPNPTGGNVTVELAASDLGGKIQVINTNGTMVQSQRCEGPVTVINTANLPNGIYMITYESNGTRVSQQLLVQH